MKIRLVDKSVYEITRAEIISGRFEIDFADKTAEEVQGIFSVLPHLIRFDLLTRSQVSPYMVDSTSKNKIQSLQKPMH